MSKRWLHDWANQDPPKMKPLEDWQREFLMNALDALAELPCWMGESNIEKVTNAVLWCFHEVRIDPTASFRTTAGRTLKLPKNYKPRFMVDQVIDRLTNNDVLGWNRCRELGYRPHWETEPLVFQLDDDLITDREWVCPNCKRTTESAYSDCDDCVSMRLVLSLVEFG